jgi:hypothetical protein
MRCENKELLQGSRRKIQTGLLVTIKMLMPLANASDAHKILLASVEMVTRLLKVLTRGLLLKARFYLSCCAAWFESAGMRPTAQAHSTLSLLLR